MGKKRISVVSAWHYFRLIYRSVLFLLLLIGYISYRVELTAALMTSSEERPVR